jgi:putative peptide zinc metalloprotease protein
MTENNKLFHESWYRIAQQRIALRPSVKIQRQLFRGAQWYVLRDPFNDQYYRLRPETYQFISRLNPQQTVEDVWKEAMARDPENAPGQGDIIELLAQLYQANLLHYQIAPDSIKLFERYKKKKQRQFRANVMNIMFFRIPLFDPDCLLKKLLPFIKRLISPYGAALWLTGVGLGIKFAIDNIAGLQVQSQRILASSNIFLLYLGLVIIKSLHEFGHAFAVRRFGGEVHTMGVMFMIFSPLPYIDASAAWTFRNKWHRVFVGAAGMIFELFIAACAMIIWAFTGPGVIHSLAYNM